MARAAGSAAPALQRGPDAFSFFLGRWDCAGHFVKSGKPISSTEVFTADVAGHWLRMEHDDRPPHSFHALEIWGYNKKTNEYSNYVFDNYSPARKYLSAGWKGQVLTWRKTGDGAYMDRFIFVRGGTDEYRVTYAARSNGKKWSTIDVLQCKRQ